MDVTAGMGRQLKDRFYLVWIYMKSLAQALLGRLVHRRYGDRFIYK